MVKMADSRGQLPPRAMDLDKLSGRARKPSVADLRAVLSLHHLVRAIEISLCRQAWMEGAIREDGAQRRRPEPAECLPGWLPQVHRAIYLSLILGAALAGAYREPLFCARSRDDAELQAISGYGRLTAKQLDFVRGFPVCQTQAAQDAEQALFDCLSQWLIRAILADQPARVEKRVGRAPRCRGGSHCAVLLHGHLEHEDGHLVVWHLMQLLCAHDWVKATVSLHRRSDAEVFRGEFAGIQAEIVPFGDFVVQAFGVPPALPRGTVPQITVLPVRDARHGAARDAVGPAARLAPLDGSETWRLLLWVRDHAPGPAAAADGGGGAAVRTPPLRFKFMEHVLRRLGFRLHRSDFPAGPGAEIWNLVDKSSNIWGVFTLGDDPLRSVYGGDDEAFLLYFQ